MTRSIFLSLSLASSLFAADGQSMSVPVAGVVLDAQAHLVAIPGVSGSLLPGRSLTAVSGETVLSTVGTLDGSVTKTPDSLFVLDAAGSLVAKTSAPPGAAVFGLDSSGNWRWTYFPETQQLASSAGRVPQKPLVGGEIVALGPQNGSNLPVAVWNDGLLSIQNVNTANGKALDRTALSGAAPCVYFEGGWLRADDGGLVWERLDGVTPVKKIAVPAKAESLQIAGPHSVAVNGRWLMTASWQLWEIPANPHRHPVSKIHLPGGHPR